MDIEQNKKINNQLENKLELNHLKRNKNDVNEDNKIVKKIKIDEEIVTKNELTDEEIEAIFNELIKIKCIKKCNKDEINYIKNPIIDLNEIYNFERPKSFVEDFKVSVKSLLDDIKSKRNIYSEFEVIQEYWSLAEYVIKKVKNLLENENNENKDLIQSAFKDLQYKFMWFYYSKFYMISQSFIDEDSSFSFLRPLFFNIHHHLEMAEEIVVWRLSTIPIIDIDNFPYICYNLCKYVKNDEVVHMFMLISLLGDNPESVQVIDKDGDITEAKILKAKKRASKKLKKMIKKIPPNYSNLRNTLNHYVIKK